VKHPNEKVIVPLFPTISVLSVLLESEMEKHHVAVPRTPDSNAKLALTKSSIFLKAGPLLTSVTSPQPFMPQRM